MVWSLQSSLVPLLCHGSGTHNTGLEVPVPFCKAPLLPFRFPNLLGMVSLSNPLPSFTRYSPACSDTFSPLGEPSLEAIHPELGALKWDCLDSNAGSAHH